MSPINFVPPDSDLLLWDKQNSPAFRSATKKSKQGSWQKQPFIPWAAAGVIISISWGLPFISNQIKLKQIANLESDHIEFEQIRAKIDSTEQTINQQKRDIQNFGSLFTSAAHAYPFTYYLQRSVPSSVSLSNFVMDQSGFNLCAFGPSYESLEDLIDLIKAMPGVETNSVRFVNMSANMAESGSASICESSSEMQPVSVQLKGKFLSASALDLESFYGDASDYGQYNKIKMFNTLQEKAGGLLP